MTILPIIFPAIEENTRSHWNQAVHGLTLNARKMFLDMDQELFDECKRRFEAEEAEAEALKKKRSLVWKRLEEEASLYSMTK
jgi:serine/threonine-protein phosphatase 2A regulatory subunit B'